MHLYRELIDRFGVYPTKTLDQHFIIDEAIFDKMIEVADVKDKDIVLEVGGGPGFLTRKLASLAKKVIVVEKDPKFLPILRRIGKNVQVIEGDAVKVRIPAFRKVVANIPFSISSPLLFRMFTKKWSTAVLILQKEFAEKMVTKLGSPDCSRLTLMSQYYADIELIATIPRGKFYPAPEVDAVIVKLTKKDVPRINTDVEKVIKSLYQHKRKRAANALINSSEALKIEKEALKKAFLKAPKYMGKRVYELKITDFEKIAIKLNKLWETKNDTKGK